ncbi:hypothetical protein KIN20_015005 [Parelaphostrongylus tenuis]|uniref:Uncharacterized protein n=1 Tax=Parelaphostrongylus tenuis TaxID=148309 RepID=A0AAD5QPK4_PARTN|nr:hypothetical protein KIN20_015005 [Parelaphostrongylus tenuis]
MISVYKIQKDYRSLSHVVDVPLLTAADNLYVEKTGAVWTGAHPVIKDAIKHLGDCDNPKYHAPSQDMVLPPKVKNFTRVNRSVYETPL